MTSKIFKRTMVIEGKSIALGVIFVSLRKLTFLLISL